MVLFNVRLLSELPLAKEMARRFVAIGEPVALCAESRAAAAAAAIEAAAREFGAAYFNMEAAADAASSRQAASTAAKLKGIAARAVSKVARQGRFKSASPLEQRFLDEFAAQRDAALSILEASQASVVIVGQDGMSGNAALIAAASSRGVPVVDCPYGFGTSMDFDDYLDEKHREGALHVAAGEAGARIQRHCPQWVRRSAYGDVLMYPAEYILARERAGLSLPLPWVIHGGAADLLAAESRAMYDHYIAEGIDPRKVQLTGTAYCDAMADEMSARAELKRAFDTASKLRAGATSVLVSLPPSLHAIRAHASEFPTYEAACAAIITMFVNRPGVDVVVSLHPNAPAEQRRFVEALGCEVSTEWIVRMIPRCDLFFTTFSSTIRWAIACGKPVLNYNMYGYNNHDYDAVDGVFTETRLRHVEAAFERLLNDGEYRAVAAKQKIAGESWGIMDGRNFERINNAVNGLRQSRALEAHS